MSAGLPARPGEILSYQIALGLAWGLGQIEKNNASIGAWIGISQRAGLDSDLDRRAWNMIARLAESNVRNREGVASAVETLKARGVDPAKALAMVERAVAENEKAQK